MIVQIYAIYDEKALTYGAPFTAATSGMATRMFKDLVDEPNTMVGKHPNDFRLYMIGTYDDQRGLLMGESPPTHVVDAISLVAVQHKLPLEEAAQ